MTASVDTQAFKYEVGEEVVVRLESVKLIEVAGIDWYWSGWRGSTARCAAAEACARTERAGLEWRESASTSWRGNTGNEDATRCSGRSDAHGRKRTPSTQ